MERSKEKKKPVRCDLTEEEYKLVTVAAAIEQRSIKQYCERSAIQAAHQLIHGCPYTQPIATQEQQDDMKDPAEIAIDSLIAQLSNVEIKLDHKLQEIMKEYHKDIERLRTSVYALKNLIVQGEPV